MIGEVRIVKMLLRLIWCISSVGLMWVALGCATRQVPKTEANRGMVPAPAADTPHVDVPKNCQRTPNADGSVLLTCDCEACGHPEPRDGMNPVPWSCTLRGKAVYCGYDNGNGLSASDGRNTTSLEHSIPDSCDHRLDPFPPAVFSRYSLFCAKG